jgi:peptidoglycan/xylan/chitin deacetylase (PgdA/CDA1 family)
VKKNLLIPIFVLVMFCSAQTNAFAAVKGREEYEKTGNVIWEMNTKEKIVAITFDDGPHPVFTPLILDILAKYQAKASFFVTGKKASIYPEIIRREVNEGHEVANHTYNHIINPNISAAKLEAELVQTDNVIQTIIGYKPTLYRPVAGYYNDVIVDTALKNGKLVVLWSWHQDPKDWDHTPASKITRHVTEAVRPGDVIVLHDWHYNELAKTCQTVIALEKILEFLYKNGYQCVTVSEMLYRANGKIPVPFGPIQ